MIFTCVLWGGETHDGPCYFHSISLTLSLSIILDVSSDDGMSSMNLTLARRRADTQTLTVFWRRVRLKRTDTQSTNAFKI